MAQAMAVRIATLVWNSDTTAQRLNAVKNPEKRAPAVLSTFIIRDHSKSQTGGAGDGGGCMVAVATE